MRWRWKESRLLKKNEMIWKRIKRKEGNDRKDIEILKIGKRMKLNKYGKKCKEINGW